MYDVIIIGGGPAGLAAAVYAARACLHTLLLEKQPMGGGQILNTAEVDNYPGIPGANGFELGQKFADHAKRLGIEPRTEEVTAVDCLASVKKVITNKGTYEAANLIYAAGARHRTLGVPGEETFAGRGVSYCATCDGAFLRGKTAAVVGGGDVALEDALFLANICRNVFLIHRRDTFRGAKSLQNRVMATDNIELILDTTVEEIHGETGVTELLIRNKKEDRTSRLAVDGIFIAAGILPYTDLLKGQVELDENGYIIADESCRTNVKGVYAAGDVRTKALRQIITAAADGANAVSAIEKR
ncbi:MAG: thioredoxin-disulfide reductase [Lachnospiraceae bacterium]|nr:thioredoxin-disulfide reductase [Lachnospiraceae bacterium]